MVIHLANVFVRSCRNSAVSVLLFLSVFWTKIYLKVIALSNLDCTAPKLLKNRITNIKQTRKTCIDQYTETWRDECAETQID